jgi:DNA-binding MarR family transcriptional regulator
MTLTDWFEERGWVERRRAPGDGRAWGLHLTQRGERLVARLKRRVADGDLARAAALTAKERRELLRLLGKLAG